MAAEYHKLARPNNHPAPANVPRETTAPGSVTVASRWQKRPTRQGFHDMIVIRRLVDAQRAYTAIFLPGEEPRIFPTTDYEHGRILAIYKQDRTYPGIVNDFTELDPSPAAGRQSPRSSRRPVR
jgi:hypothetical protein